MNTPLTRAFIVASITLFSSFLWSANDPLPKADEVLKKAIARAEWEKKNDLEEKWAATLRVSNDKLDKEGKVEKHEERLLQPVSIGGKAFHRVVEKDGKPLSASDQKKQAEREQKFRESLSKPRKPDADDDDIDLNEDLISRFNFNVIGREVVNGRGAYLLTFLPRTGVKLPEKRHMDRLLNRLEGRVWIDTEDYALLKVDMHLTEPTTLMGGLGSVRSLDFLMEMAAVAPKIYAPKEVDISFEGRKLFSSMRVKQKSIFTDYRKVSELAEAKDQK